MIINIYQSSERYKFYMTKEIIELRNLVNIFYPKKKTL